MIEHSDNDHHKVTNGVIAFAVLRAMTIQSVTISRGQFKDKDMSNGTHHVDGDVGHVHGTRVREHCTYLLRPLYIIQKSLSSLSPPEPANIHHFYTCSDLKFQLNTNHILLRGLACSEYLFSGTKVCIAERVICVRACVSAETRNSAGTRPP